MRSVKVELPAWGGAICLHEDSVHLLALVFIGPGDDEASQHLVEPGDEEASKHLVNVLIVALVDILYVQPTLWLLLLQGDNMNVACCALPVSITLSSAYLFAGQLHSHDF